MAKISTFIIMIVVFSLFLVAGIQPLLDYGDERYDIDGYNSSSIDSYNRITSIESQTADLKNKTLTLQSESGVTDVLGGFFESGYDAVRLAFSSFEDFFAQTDQFFKEVTFDNAELFKTALITVVLVTIIFIIISTVVKNKI